MGSKDAFNIKRSIFLPLAAGLSVFLLVFITVLFWVQYTTAAGTAKQHIHMVEDAMNAQVAEDAHLLHGLLELLEDRGKLQDYFIMRDREGLYDHTLPIYKKLNRNYNVTHFYFINPDGECFLRMHNEERSGDIIDRYTFTEAKRRGELFSGTELGPLGTFTLRVVLPWYRNGRCIGYLELGEETDHILPKISSLLGVELILFINKAFLDREGWEEGNRMQHESGNWDAFSEYVAASSTLPVVPKRIIEELSTDRVQHDHRIFALDSNGRKYLAGFDPLIQADGTDVGTIAVLYDVSTAERLTQIFIIVLFAFYLGLGGILLFLFNLYLGRMQKQLIDIRNRLEDEIEERRTAMESLSEARQEAEQASRIKGEFLANMSHEIRTPMNGILGMITLLSDTDLNQIQRDYVDSVEKSARSLLHIINDILDFSKLDAGKLDLNEMEFNLRVTIEDLCTALAVTAEEKGLEFSCYIESDVPLQLYGDPGRLRQILVNLIGNAVKFTDTGHVTLNVCRVPAAGLHDHDCIGLEFSVSDTGIGIREEEQVRIFESFMQGGGKQEQVFRGGTGLGLSISSQLVDLMGGSLGFTSRPGEGSRFYFTLRMRTCSRPDEAKMILPKDIRSGRFLIVDDHQLNRQVIAEYLKSFGCRYVSAEDGEKALAAAREAAEEGHPFTAAIIDMMMPGMDGRQLGEKIKADPLLSSTKLLMLTSVGRRGDALDLRSIGFSGYLNKPVRYRELFDCLNLLVNEEAEGMATADGDLITKYRITEMKEKSLRVLVAEDNKINQKVAAKMLEKIGIKADFAQDGGETLEMLEAQEYDLLLLDIQMPVVDGYEVARAVRGKPQNANNRDIIIIAMTAYAMEGDREKCLEAGMDDYLAKPIEQDKLIEMLHSYFPIGAEADTIGNDTEKE